MATGLPEQQEYTGGGGSYGSTWGAAESNPLQSHATLPVLPLTTAHVASTAPDPNAVVAYAQSLSTDAGDLVATLLQRDEVLGVLATAERQPTTDDAMSAIAGAEIQGGTEEEVLADLVCDQLNSTIMDGIYAELPGGGKVRVMPKGGRTRRRVKAAPVGANQYQIHSKNDGCFAEDSQIWRF